MDKETKETKSSIFFLIYIFFGGGHIRSSMWLMILVLEKMWTFALKFMYRNVLIKKIKKNRICDDPVSLPPPLPAPFPCIFQLKLFQKVPE